MDDALLSAFMITWELTPFSTWSFTSFNISPASTTTDVVPSPTSASCERAMSVSMRAAGWTMSKSYAGLAELNMESQRPHFHNRCAIVGDGLLAVCINEQQVPAIWAECASNSILYRKTCVDVGYYLSLTLRRVGTYAQILEVYCIKVTRREP